MRLTSSAVCAWPWVPMSRLRIVVGGFAGLLPAGGVTWDYLQYPLGFLLMGHDVYYVEDTRLWPNYQVSADGLPDCSTNVAYLDRVSRQFGLGERWSYRDEVTGSWFGLSQTRVSEILRTADVFINVSAATTLSDDYLRIPARVMIDSDPMFTQIQFLNAEGFTPEALGMWTAVRTHTHHFTFGEAIGRSGCRIPSTGVRWHPTRQPICLDQWTPSPPPESEAGFTTVMNWSAARRLEWGGESWGQKDIEFEKIVRLPTRFRSRSLSVAMGQTGGHDFPIERLTGNGWQIIDPAHHVATPDSYRHFIECSLGEFSVAKETYVKAKTGWFSCRSACYLATGRPVVTQDTGWSALLPSDEGLIAFTDLDGAVDALERVSGNPQRHGRRAREIAEEFFDSRRVLGRLLQTIGVAG